jgi:hypothetical protein
VKHEEGNIAFFDMECSKLIKHPETNLALNDVRYVESAQNVKKIGKKTASPLKSKGKMWLNFSISVFQKLTILFGGKSGNVQQNIPNYYFFIPTIFVFM